MSEMGLIETFSLFSFSKARCLLMWDIIIDSKANIYIEEFLDYIETIKELANKIIHHDLSANFLLTNISDNF